MPLGTLFVVTLETTEPVGDQFIEGVIIDGLGKTEDDGGNITSCINQFF